MEGNEQIEELKELKEGDGKIEVLKEGDGEIK